jgi:signal transduction histidine kinase
MTNLDERNARPFPLPRGLAESHDGAGKPDDGPAALRELLRRKDEFLAVLAHELRNPLAPLRNGVQLVRVIGTHDSKIASLLTMMDRQLGILTRLVDDLLDVSRIETGKLQIDLAPVNLIDAVRASCDATTPQLQHRRHAVRLSTCEEPCYVNADSDRLHQVFANLLSNAIKYSDAATKIEVRIEAEKHWVRVEVQDQGVGLSPEEVGNIFDMYSQVRLHRARAEGGLGIGLALVQRLVELHGGRVWASSDGSGRGSTFYVCLPRVHPAGLDGAGG